MNITFSDRTTCPYGRWLMGEFKEPAFQQPEPVRTMRGKYVAGAKVNEHAESDLCETHFKNVIVLKIFESMDEITKY